MRRRRAAVKPLTPDVKYNSELIAKLINTVMIDGKKSVAEKIVYGALEILAEKVPGQETLEVFLTALENAKPRLEVKSRRVGGATYQVPLEIPSSRQGTIAMRWMVNYARGRKGKPMREALAGEMFDAFNNTGSTVKKKDDTHKMAAANKAFAHYRW
ncbi:MAG: 30S ribosomal protein S7 [Lentisphaeria bacterium]